MENKKLNTPEKEIQVVLKDGTELVLMTFGKRDKELKVPVRSGKGEVEVPRFVYFSKSNYGFDMKAGILAKYCRKCGAWYAISKLLEDGTWENIYSIHEVHFDGIRFRSYCNGCYASQKAEKVKKPEQTKTISKPESAKAKKISNKGLKKVTFHISDDDLQFMHLVKAIDRASITGVLAMMIDKERIERNLKF